MPCDYDVELMQLHLLLQHSSDAQDAHGFFMHCGYSVATAYLSGLYDREVSSISFVSSHVSHRDSSLPSIAA